MGTADRSEIKMNWFFICLGLVLVGHSTAAANGPYKLRVGVLFTAQIDQSTFNWTLANGALPTDEFKFQVSLRDYPDLPSFLRFTYSEERKAAFLYGSPTEQFSNRVIELDVVALNKRTYETRKEGMVLRIEGGQSSGGGGVIGGGGKKKIIRNVIQMKIDLMDLIDLMDPGRMADLKNVFGTELWPESAMDLSVVFLEAAVNMGSRLPASPQLKEGVIVQLGSSAAFSERLLQLQEEVRPLYKMSSCTFKRTSVQAIFENQGFKLDWCAFKLIELQHGNASRIKSELTANRGSGSEQWQGLKYEDIPERNYIDEMAITIAVPGTLLVILLFFLSGILCFQHESISRNEASTAVTHLSTGANTTTTTSLKHLRDAPGTLPDDYVSDDSHTLPGCSREGNLPLSHLTLSSTYLRPKPPPYNRSPGATQNSTLVNAAYSDSARDRVAM